MFPISCLQILKEKKWEKKPSQDIQIHNHIIFMYVKNNTFIVSWSLYLSSYLLLTYFNGWLRYNYLANKTSLSAIRQLLWRQMRRLAVLITIFSKGFPHFHQNSLERKFNRRHVKYSSIVRKHTLYTLQ